MSKTLEFIYQETKIHFLINPSDNNVMVNATEMAKMFGKRTDHYLQNETTKQFIEALKVPDISGTLTTEIVENRGRNGIYFCELLAIDFATWLDVNFKVWVYQRIQEAIFGNYKKHWEAHVVQEDARKQMERLKKELLLEPTQEAVINYFEQECIFMSAKNAKRAAIANQMKMDL
jgi:hypothetical protein